MYTIINASGQSEGQVCHSAFINSEVLVNHSAFINSSTVSSDERNICSYSERIKQQQKIQQ